MSTTRPTTTDLAFAPALEQARLIRGREVSPVELTQLFLDRIDRFDGPLNSYLTVADERALDTARAAERRLDDPGLPAFHGVPISIKDLMATAGIRTTYGIESFRDHVPTQDEHSVGRVRAAGFTILGKTNTPEKGTGCVTEPPAYGPARNPWETALTPGGSSGGAGAALAAGLCPIAHGSDGGGSIRVPSAWCGVVGVKPSRGRILASPTAISLHATVGPMARTVSDAAALLDALTGPALGPDLWGLAPERSFLARTHEAPGRLRIAFSDGDQPLSPGYGGALARTAELLEELGHTVVEADPGPRWPSAFFERVFTEAGVRRQSADLEAMTRADTRMRFLHPCSTGLLGHADGLLAIDYLLEQQAMKADIARWAAQGLALFADHDVLLTPTVARRPLPVGLHEQLDPLELWRTWYEAVPFTTMWNQTGQPAVSLPLHTDPDGLPIGMQLVGRPADEATLFRLAAQLEQALPWHDRVPPGYA
ncbi:MAG TPA: amidase [Nitriliruptorales bacterium]